MFPQISPKNILMIGPTGKAVCLTRGPRCGHDRSPPAARSGTVQGTAQAPGMARGTARGTAPGMAPGTALAGPQSETGPKSQSTGGSSCAFSMLSARLISRLQGPPALERKHQRGIAQNRMSVSMPCMKWSALTWALETQRWCILLVFNDDYLTVSLLPVFSKLQVDHADQVASQGFTSLSLQMCCMELL